VKFSQVHLLLTLLLGSVNACFGQTFSYQKFTVKDGLPHSNIFRIYQDKKGFLWLATDYGLSRYDGTQFVNFRSNHSYGSDAILSVTQAPNEVIWASSNGGGLQYLKNDTLTSFPTKGLACPRSVLYSDFDKQGAWIIDRNGFLYRLQSNNLNLIAGNIENGFRRMVRQDGNILFATDSGIYTYVSGEGLKHVLKSITGRVYAMQTGSAHMMWIALKNEIIKVKDSIVTQRYYLGNTSDISDLLVDSEENIWVAIPGRGLFLKQKAERGFTDVSEKLDLRNILVNDLFEDRSGNVWIATHGSGLYCIQSLNIVNYPVQSGTINNYTKAITVAGDAIYFGSIGTISKYHQGVLEPLEIKYLSKIDFVYFVELYEGTLMIGTPTRLIVKSTTPPFAEREMSERGYISYLRVDKDHVWLGGFDFVFLLEKGQAKKQLDPMLRKRRFNCINSDSIGAVYFGTDSGVIVYRGGTCSYFSPGYFAGVPINQILVDSKKRFWFATDNGVFVSEGQKVTRLPAYDKNMQIKATHIVESKDGKIWIATLNGLWQYDSGRLIPFFRNAELITREILSLGCDEKNNLWLGTVNGISVITHITTHRSRPSPAVYITEVRNENTRLIFPDSADSYSPGNTQIVFSGIELPSAAALEYEYRIIGLSDKWFMTNGKTLELSSLPIGNYEVQVRARIKDSPWGSAARLHLHVSGPFWKSSWFVVFIILIAIGMLYVGIRWQIHHVTEKKRNEILIKDKMVQLKQQALAALINPHFIFNCLNSIQSYIQLNDREQANKYLVQFSRLVRITLDHAQESFISLETEMDRIDLYLQLEKLRFGDKLTYSITEDPLKYKERIEIPNMVIQPYIENAIKHGIMPRKEGGAVTIKVQNGTPGYLSVIIEDNGLGISTSRAENVDTSLHRSLGMSLTKERLDLLEQLHNRTFRCEVADIKDGAGVTLGTRVTLIFNYEATKADAIA
jgi:ligand-binding sensor domain-containing protein/two-component sensor histidine kinase